MNLNARDLGIIFAMSIAVIAMSFTFPALGLTGNEQDENDIPDFNIGASAFDFAGEFPSGVDDRPNDFRLIYKEGEYFNSSGVILEGGADKRKIFTSDNERVEIAGVDSITETVDIHINTLDTTSNNLEFDSLTLEYDSASETATYSTNGWEFVIRLISWNDMGNDGTATVSVELAKYPERFQSEGIDGSSLEGIINGLVFIGEIFYWGTATLIELIVNIFVITVEVTAYIVNLLSWLTSTYASIVSGAPGWASVIVAIPGILLSLQFLKLVIISVEIIWIG